MKDKLLPCPFCGNDNTDPANLQGVHIVDGTGKAWGLPTGRLFFVRCGKCFARGGNGVAGPTGSEAQARQAAVNRWNTRATP